MRTFSSLAIAALSGGNVTCRMIVRVTLPSGVWGASDGPDTFSWDNGGGAGPISFVPLDAAMKITLPPLQTALRTDPALIQVSATDPRLLAQLLNEDYRGAPTDICQLIYENGVPAEEILRFQGLMDQGTLEDAPFKSPTAGGHDDEPPIVSTLSMSVAPETLDIKRANGRWATMVDQQLYRDAADTFFQDVALVGVSTINWGQAGASSPASSATNVSANGAPSGVAAILGRITIGGLTTNL